MKAALARRIAVATALMAGLVGQAWAHAHLRESVPAADASVQTSPTELDLRFSEGLELAFTGLTLTAAGDKPIPTGPARLDPSDAALLVVPVVGALAAGAYTVDWHALSADGHKTQGRYVFSVKP